MGTSTDAPRVAERHRAVALARYNRQAEGLSIAQIAQRLGRSPATIKSYFYDPDGEKARAVKARYQGVCRGCGAPTQARNGKGDAYDARRWVIRRRRCCRQDRLERLLRPGLEGPGRAIEVDACDALLVLELLMPGESCRVWCQRASRSSLARLA